MKQSTILHKAGNLVAAVVMLFFSIMKLIGGQEVIENFKLMESFVPIDINVFRILTGIVEFLIALLLIVYTIKNKENLGKLAYALLLGTMVGALFMEFVAKLEPMMMMAIIAIVLLTFSIYKLKALFNK